MNRADIRTEVEDRGFTDVGSTRINRWINQSYRGLCEREYWPFLEKSVSGNPPLEISDLRQILSVVDDDNDFVLPGVDRREVIRTDPNLDSTGDPEAWYLEDNELNVWPPNTGTNLSIRYIFVPAQMTSDADEPVVPERWQDLIVDAVVLRAYKDSDEWEAYINLKQIYEQGVEEMANSLLHRNYANPEFIVPSGVFWDYS